MLRTTLGLQRPKLLVPLVFCLMVPFSVSSQLSETIGYQGLLADDAGNPVNGTVSIKFAIHDAAAGGNELWTETHPSVTVTDGVFNVQLGSIVSFRSAGLAFDRPYFLGIDVASDGEMVPRLELSMSPASLVAGGQSAEVSVDCANGGSIQDAVDKAWLGRPLIVNVNGNCIENVAVRRDNVTLRGQGTDKITGVTPHADSRINATVYTTARGFVIDNLIIEGAPGDTTAMAGLGLFDGAVTLLMNGSVIQNHDGEGIWAIENSSLDLFNTTVRNNGVAKGRSGIFINSNSHLDTREGTVIQDNGEDGIYLRLSSSATIEDTSILNNGDPARDDLWANGIHVEDASSVRLRGGNTIITDMPYGDVGAAIAAYRGAVVRIVGDNTIQAPTANFDPDSICSFCPEAGGMAMDIEMNSIVRQQSGKAIITGWIESFNGSSVDLRDTDFTGHLEASLTSNFRLRDQTPGGGVASINGNIVLWGTGELSIRTPPDSQAPVINGTIYCYHWFSVPSNITFQDPEDGYIRCSGIPADGAVALTDSLDPVSVGDPLTIQITFTNNSSSPATDVRNVNLSINLNGSQFRLDAASFPGGNCSVPFGNIQFNLDFSCFVGDVASGDSVTVDVEVTPLQAGTLNANVNYFSQVFDPVPDNNLATESTTVNPL